MLKRFLATLVLAVGLAPVAAQAAPDCAALKSLQIPLTTIEAAEDVAAPHVMVVQNIQGEVPLTIDRSFCRVKGLIKPAPSSNIRFETWLPHDWNGSYFQAGNGGLAGSIPFAPMAEALARGYAAGGTDDGTTGRGDLSWQSDPERQRDYRVRAVHYTAVAGQALVRAYYGKPAAHAYFVGGSKGGQEALQEVQDFPQDFDGVVAIYPTIRGAHMVASLFWAAQQMNRSPEAMLKERQLALLHRSALAACAGRDGGLVTDGFLTYPPACRFDPDALRCKASPAPDCLTVEQVKTARALYEGPSDPRTGKSYGMGLFRGGEAPSISIAHGWGGHDGATVRALALENGIGRNTFGQADWSYRSFTFDTDFDKLTAGAGEDANGDTFKADVRAFKARGGKLILIHGWNDPIVPAANSILYFERVTADQETAPGRRAGRSALDETRGFFRLFMTPGFGHGPTTGVQPIDPLGAIAAWVETGTAPAVLPAAQYEPGSAKRVRLKRDLCPWPERAVMVGAAVVCRAAAPWRRG